MLARALRFWAPLGGLSLCAVLALFGAAPSRAYAQGGVSSHSVSDAVYIGGRLEPDGAWLVDYDLDILLTSASVGISIGPNVSFAFASDGGNDLGRRQEWLLAADFLRARWAMLSQYGFRVSILAGAGMWVASFYDQSTQPRDVVLLDGTVVRASEHFPGAYVPGALLSVGASADWFWDAQWGLSAYAVGHIRLDQENRMPAFWIELGIGIRLGE